jgi:hypothetical protein
MSIDPKELEPFLKLPHDELMAKLYNPETPIAEWAAVTEIIERRGREKRAV